MAYNPDNLTKVFDADPHLTAREVARRIAPSLDSDEIARTAQRVKHYARDGLIHAECGGGEGPGRYRRYSDYSVYQAALVQEMKLSGVSLDAIGNAIAKICQTVDGISPLMNAFLRRFILHKHPDQPNLMPDQPNLMKVIYLVVNCADGEAWTGGDLSQAPIGPAQFVFNLAAIFEKVRL